MNALFEVVAPSVRDDFGIDDMNFPDRPTIEASLREELFKQCSVAHLNIARTQTNTLHERGIGDRARIIVMNDPCDCAGARAFY